MELLQPREDVAPFSINYTVPEEQRALLLLYSPPQPGISHLEKKRERESLNGGQVINLNVYRRYTIRTVDSNDR